MYAILSYSFSKQPSFPVILYGNNATTNILDGMFAMLDQNLDEIESEVSKAQTIPPLNEPASERGKYVIIRL